MTTKKKPKDRRVTEKQARAEVRQWAKAYGWLIFPIPAGPFSVKGLPDYLLMKSGIVAFVEVKGDKGKQRKEQQEFQSLCESEGIIYILARRFEDLDMLKFITISVGDAVIIKHTHAMRVSISRTIGLISSKHAEED